MKRVFYAKYVTGELYKGVSGLWRASVSYGIAGSSKGFETEEEALEWLADYGLLEN